MTFCSLRSGSRSYEEGRSLARISFVRSKHPIFYFLDKRVSSLLSHTKKRSLHICQRFFQLMFDIGLDKNFRFQRVTFLPPSCAAFLNSSQTRYNTTALSEGMAPCIFSNASIKVCNCRSALRTPKPRTVTLPGE